MKVCLIILTYCCSVGCMITIRQKFQFNARVGLKLHSLQNAKFSIPKGYSDASLRYVLKHECKSGLPDLTKHFTVLGIESSCDDTGVAIVRSDGKILSNVVYSQHDIHEKFGGIVPTLAMEQHKLNIEVAVEEAVKKAGLQSLNDIDAVAVTKGPGLEICLRVGIRKAQAIAKQFQKPFVTVHHLEAHCMLARLAGEVQSICAPTTAGIAISTAKNTTTVQEHKEDDIVTLQADETSATHFKSELKFPFLVLLASGGHTSLLLCEELGQYTVLGGTLDDALGEAFDKAARMLGLRGAGGGGVAIERTAAIYSTTSDTGGKMSATKKRTNAPSQQKKQLQQLSGMTIPMRDKPNCDFSYAGLKTSFRQAVERARAAQGYDIGNQTASNAPIKEMTAAPEPVTLPEQLTGKLCADFQEVAFTHVEDRVRRALEYIDMQGVPATALVVVGGVAANLELRRKLHALLSAHAERLDNLSKLFTTTTSSSNSSVRNSSDTTVHPPTPISLVCPPPALCTDNGLMVAWTGVEKLTRGISNSIEDQEATPRWPIGTPLSVEDKAFMTQLKKLQQEKSRKFIRNWKKTI